MEMERAEYTVKEILDLRSNGMLAVNAEYQRGAVWTKSQKQKLIDSILRGYPLPLLYFRHIKKDVAGMKREDFEIIDGQQRINALFEFSEGAFKLLDPAADQKGNFPQFLKDKPCVWADKDIHSLENDLRSRFLDTSLSTAKVTTDDDNEARDLFIRLQAGIPLNPQEKRDAWPGNFTDFVLRIGGKPQIARYPGHEFFKRVLRMKPRSDRGRTRVLAAQIAMLYMTRKEKGPTTFIDINSASIDHFYYLNLDFKQNSPEAERLETILDRITRLLGHGKRPKPRAHDAIHLVLLVDSLMEDYAPTWEDKLASAFDAFSEKLAHARMTKDDPVSNEYWTRYGQWTRVSSDRGERIARRHEFYIERMLEEMAPLDLKDPKRAYGELEREVIYYRDGGKCAVCKGSVDWGVVEIHHIREHAKGGPTDLINGVLVHKECHPRGDKAVDFERLSRGH